MIDIREGSLLDFQGDCIVNPANSFLNHGGGLARIIASAAMKPREGENPFRPGLFEEENRRHPLIPVGGVGVTSAGALPYKGIIHAVGPIYGGGEYLESNLLASAHQRAFHAAVERGWKSIGVPAISCGIFGYPADEAATLAVHVARRWEDDLDIVFYPFGYEFQYNDALGRLF